MSDKKKTPPQSNNRIFSPSNSQNQGNTNLNNDDQRLAELGFEEGELEMFFDTYNISPDALIRKYLEIAQKPPYNLNWDTESVAASANKLIGVFNRYGDEYVKHDIAEDTLNSFYHPEEYQDQGIVGGIRKTKRRKIRKTKRRKIRKTKRRKTRNIRRH
jgi:hypothetical protein